MSEPVLKVKDFTVEFWVDGTWYPAAVDMNFELNPGQVLAIVGESGSGKSTTAMGLMSLLATNARMFGSVKVKGQEMLGAKGSTLRKFRGKEVAYIFQEPMTALNPVYTIGFQIIETLRTHFDMGPKEARVRALELITMVELPDPEISIDKYPHQLSGGQRQRAMIAQALACDPGLLIADEPTTALDVSIQSQILDLIKKLTKERNLAVILITHDMGVIAETANRVAVMKNGDVVEALLPVGDFTFTPDKTIENHFLAKLPGEEDAIITDTKKVINTLNALCIEMDNRYDLLKEAGCRNIKEYNEKFTSRKLNPEKGHQYLPFIVLVEDEFADLIMTAGKEVEMPIARLAQLARAVGIHLIIATQRPSVNIITGTIKANFPARIAFKVSSKIDSRTILDAGGAEQLIGKGDMLVSYNGEITRLQCAFVDTPEVEAVCEFIGDQKGYPQAFLLPEYVDEKDMEGRDFDSGDRDPLFEDAARLIVQSQMGSTSLIQRRMKLGYNRAGRLMDQLEAAGIVGPNQGSKAREVRFKTDSELEMFLETL